MQHHAADQLNVVMPHAEKTLAAFATDRKRLGQNIVQRFSRAKAVSELLRLFTQLILGKCFVF